MMPRRETLRDYSGAVVFWIAAGLSVGWYYTVAYYGAGSWPIPHPEFTLCLLIFYYFPYEASIQTESILWIVATVASGLLWAALLTITAPFFDGRRAQLSYAVFRFSLASLPFALVGPWLVYASGITADGLDWSRVWSIAQRQIPIENWPWLNPLYFGVAVAALVVHLYVYRLVLDVRGKKAWLHYCVCSILAGLAGTGMGILAAYPIAALVR